MTRRFTLRALRLASWLLALLLTSCTHKELCELHPHTLNYMVDFDWCHAPGANPESMVVYFYPSEGTNAPVRRYDFGGSRGDSINIQEGRYKVLCYNSDMEGVQFRATDLFHTHEAFTREGSVFENIYGTGAQFTSRQGEPSERTVINPDMMWSADTMEVDITPSGHLTLYPRQRVCHYSYEIINVKNVKYVKQMCAALTSMAPSITLAGAATHPERVTIPAPAINDHVSRISGEFLTFGHHPDAALPHYLIIYMWLADGSKVYYRWDVNQQIHDAPDPLRVHILIDGLELPKPIINGGGFSPSVDDWGDNIDEDIIM